MTYTAQEAALLMQACDVLRTAYGRGWISTRDGNVSVSTAPGSFFITPSGVVKHRLTPSDLILSTCSGDADGRRAARASGEFDLHRHLQALLPVAYTTVLHVHATHVVAALYAGYRLSELAMQFPEVSRYTRVGPDVPALAATSPDLAEATRQAFTSADGLPHIVGLDRHGVVSVGRDPWEAFEHIERLEHICQIALVASYSGSGRKGSRILSTATSTTLPIREVAPGI